MFKCSCFPCLWAYNKHKLDDRSFECVFFGYVGIQKAYICYDLGSFKYFINSHVCFLENRFHFSHMPKFAPFQRSDWLVTLPSSSFVSHICSKVPIVSPPSTSCLSSPSVLSSHVSSVPKFAPAPIPLVPPIVNIILCKLMVKLVT